MVVVVLYFVTILPFVITREMQGMNQEICLVLPGW